MPDDDAKRRIRKLLKGINVVQNVETWPERI